MRHRKDGQLYPSESSEARHINYLKHRKHTLAQQKQYAQRHPEIMSARRKDYYKRNKENLSQKHREYYIKNSENIKSRVKNNYHRDIEETRRRQRAYRKISRQRPEVKAMRVIEGRKRYKKNPEYTRANVLKNKYGLTVEQYDDMVNRQGGVCAICGKGNDRLTKWGTRTTRLVIDHCHATGKVRGLLCHTCNSGIGSLGDSVDNLSNAIEYLIHNTPSSIS